MEGINVLAVVVAVVVAAVILTVIYAPPVLGKTWADAVAGWTGQTPEQLSGDVPRRMALWLVTALVDAVVLAILMRDLAMTGVVDALWLGFLLWLGFGGTFSAWPVIFANQPTTIWLINNGAFLAMQLAMSVTLAIIR